MLQDRGHHRIRLVESATPPYELLFYPISNGGWGPRDVQQMLVGWKGRKQSYAGLTAHGETGEFYWSCQFETRDERLEALHDLIAALRASKDAFRLNGYLDIGKTLARVEKLELVKDRSLMLAWLKVQSGGNHVTA